jgi:hypothetical protein
VITIYALKDPRDNAVRYVGRTEDLPRRYKGHLSIGGGYHPAGKAKHAWVAELRALGQQPIVEVLEECADKIADAREAWWITKHKGPLLLNRNVFRQSRRPLASPRRGKVAVALTDSESTLVWRLAALDGETVEIWIRKLVVNHLCTHLTDGSAREALGETKGK